MSTRGFDVIVTGVAGFIGSHLAERLLSDGCRVLGVDCFTDYYPRALKEANLGGLRRLARFRFLEEDILELDWAPLLAGAECLFHEAAQPGVRQSWGGGFEGYVRNNTLATARLLEAAKASSSLKAFVFASSSSVYGDVETLPISEDAALQPVSPYGVTKLACEQLCRVYHRSFDVPVVALRYFTAYGPRQRPDMAFSRFITAMLRNESIVVYGDGEQTRDFTYVSDVVDANISAMNRPVQGQVLNVGGASRITINRVIETLERIMGKRAAVSYVQRQKGDARHTWSDITRARRLLGYEPEVDIETGLTRQVAWMTEHSGQQTKSG